MSVQWTAPCGCIIEFEGQLVDKGAPIKQHKLRCARHDRGVDHVRAADDAFDDCKLKSSVSAHVEDAEKAVGEFVAYYERTGALKIAPVVPLTERRKSELTTRLAQRFGEGKVEIV